MGTRRHRMWSLPFLLLMAASLAATPPAIAAVADPIGIGPIDLTVQRLDSRALSNGKLGIVIDVIGAGLVDCGDNLTCADADLDGHEVEVRQTIDATYDTTLGRVSGRIVIGAGFKGSVKGTLEPAGAGIWALTLSMRARSTRRDRAAFELHGRLDRADRVIDALTGSGIVSMDDVDQI